MRIFWNVLGAAAGLIVLYLAVQAVTALFIDPKKEYRRDSAWCRFLLVSMTAIALFLARVRLQTEGTEKLPKGRFLLVCNHISNFDPIVTWLILRKQNVAFLTKEENLRIPVYGRFVRACCFLPIDRKNPHKAAETVRKAASLMADDVVSFGVYPEGTRNRKPEQGLLPFHSGVLMAAQKASVPIVVAAVTGTDRIAKNYPLRRTVVHFSVLDVIPAETVAVTRTPELCGRTRDVIASALGYALPAGKQPENE